MQSYNHFTLKERICIAEFLDNGKSIRKIANFLKRNPSSVSHEINKNKDNNGVYNAFTADDNYHNNRKKSKRKFKIFQNKELFNFIIDKLNINWSPEMIAIRAQTDLGIIISAKTIYNAIKNNLLPNIHIKTHLRRRGKKYRGGRHKYDTIKPEHFITDRSKAVLNRFRFGHWEGDTILGAVGKGCIVTVIERKSRFLIACKSKSKSKTDVSEALIKAFKNIDVDLKFLSLTLDNGSEFADFRNIEKELNTIIYFADPHAPWQRGSNENINGVLRFYYPKGTNFLKVSDEDIQEKINMINNRPRKCLGNLSPYEYLAKRNKVLHLT